MMEPAILAGLCASLVIGVACYALIVNPDPLRKVIAFNVLGSGVFLLFGTIARRGAGAGFAADPVPQALLITALVVAFCATALVITLILKLSEAAGAASLSPDSTADSDDPR